MDTWLIILISIIVIPCLVLGTRLAIECDKDAGPKYNNITKRVLMFFWCIIMGTLFFMFLGINKNARTKFIANIKNKSNKQA